jgi:DNA repair exonuclease SbcCD ATPase subunit
MNGKLTSLKSVNELFAKIWNVSPSSVNLVTSSELLEHSLGKDLAEYLLNGGFLNNDLTLNHILELNPVSEDVEACFREKLPEDPQVITLQDVDAAYNHFLQLRPALKRKVAELEALANQEVAVPEITIEVLKEKEKSLSREIVKIEQNNAEYPKRLKEKEKLEKQIADIEKKLSEFANIPTVTNSDIENARKSKSTVDTLVNEITVLIRTLENDIKTFDKAYESLSSPACPLSANIVCTTDKTPIKQELENLINSKYDELANASIRLEDYKQQQKDAATKLEDLQKAANDNKLKESYQNQLKSCKSINITIPELVDENYLKGLKEQYNTIKEQMMQVDRYEKVITYRKQFEDFKRKLLACEETIKQLAPNGGIRKLILSHAVGVLEDYCNDKLSVILPKWQMYFDPNNNFEIMMKNDLGSISYSSLSTGEQLRTIFVIMSMLNGLNGVNVLLLDNLNNLDIETFKTFIQMIDENSSEFDNIFIAGFNNPQIEKTFAELKSSYNYITMPV